MDLEFRKGFQKEWIKSILSLHNKTDMKRSTDDCEKFIRAFSSRYAFISCWSKDRLVGFGSMISDGEMYSSIFDVVVDPDFQKQGIGREIMDRLIQTAPHTCFHLTSTFGNEAFYKQIGFKRHKTAFAKYPWPSEYLED